jgi:pimeloyl-ACP methyl ester carboxylesterase
VTCLPPDIRTKLLDNGQDNPSGGDPVAELASLSDQATTACKDFLQPQELTYDAVHAADDIDQLRKQWRVDRIGLLGIGNGALVATSYAAKYPENVGRLALDSPQAFGVNQVNIAEQRVQGAEAALTAFAQRCTAIRCSLGADPRAVVTDLLHRAGAGQLPGITANGVLIGISGFLGAPRGDQADHTAELADALAAAGRGDVTGLHGIIDRATGETATDGQFVANCSDLQQRAPLQQARDLRTTWGQKYPVFGEQAAIGLVACTSWPTMNPAPTPTHYKVPTLVLSGAADPVTGSAGVNAVTGGLSAGGAANTVVAWQGFGHPATTHSACAQQYVVDYLAGGKLPQNGAACPA